MADTARGNFTDKSCSDCGELGCVFVHNGDLVPKGETGSFCGFCWNERLEASRMGELPKPLGVKSPGVPKRFLTKPIKVITKNGSVYKFGKPDKEGVRKAFCATKKFEFTKCRITCLRIGRRLWFRPIDSSDPGLHAWITSPVLSIKQMRLDL